jgi:hypothetical protein
MLHKPVVVMAKTLKTTVYRSDNSNLMVVLHKHQQSSSIL